MKTPHEHADHPNALRVVDKNGAITKDVAEMMLSGKLSPAQVDALKEQALRQEVYGIREGKR